VELDPIPAPPALAREIGASFPGLDVCWPSNARIFEELGLDSIDLVELVASVEAAAGVSDHEEFLAFPQLTSWEDVLDYFGDLCRWLNDKQTIDGANP
jgi:acyl carrier protein